MYLIKSNAFDLCSLIGTLIKEERIYTPKPNVYPSNIISDDGGVIEFWHYISYKNELVKRFYYLEKDWITQTRDVCINTPSWDGEDMRIDKQPSHLKFEIVSEDSDGICEVALAISELEFS